jgi:hypothetical protein
MLVLCPSRRCANIKKTADNVNFFTIYDKSEDINDGSHSNKSD